MRFSDPIARSILLHGGVTVSAAMEFLHPTLRPGQRHCAWCDAAFTPSPPRPDSPGDCCSQACAASRVAARTHGLGERPTPARWRKPLGAPTRTDVTRSMHQCPGCGLRTRAAHGGCCVDCKRGAAL